MSSLSDADRAELEEAVGKELAARGVRGTIALAGGAMELRHASGDAPVSIELDTILEQWPLLPPEIRQRKADEIARRLVGALETTRLTTGHREVPAAGDARARSQVVGAVAALFGLLAVIGAARFILPRVLGDDKPRPKPPTEGDRARSERLARACEATRDHLYKGSGFGPFALEGWAVELWLARRDGSPIQKHPAIATLANGDRLAPSADADLAKILDGRVEMTEGPAPGDTPVTKAGAQPGWGAVTVVFRDGYARAFFETDYRPRFVRLAERLSEATGADLAALYARCAHLPTHDVGAFFRGPDMPGAAAVVVYQMGLFAESRVIDRTALAAVAAKEGSAGKPAGDLDAIRKAAGVFAAGGDAPGDRGGPDTAARLLSAKGASVTTSAAGWTTVVFPLTAPMRPLAAAQELARRMGIGVPSAD